MSEKVPGIRICFSELETFLPSITLRVPLNPLQFTHPFHTAAPESTVPSPCPACPEQPRTTLGTARALALLL